MYGRQLEQGESSAVSLTPGPRCGRISEPSRTGHASAGAARFTACARDAPAKRGATTAIGARDAPTSAARARNCAAATSPARNATQERAAHRTLSVHNLAICAWDPAAVRTWDPVAHVRVGAGICARAGARGSRRIGRSRALVLGAQALHLGDQKVLLVDELLLLLVRLKALEECDELVAIAHEDVDDRLLSVWVGNEYLEDVEGFILNCL
mmetsp:Transcript_7961/g.25147  ORF Transcript_7961/g.25147 Transcript_7961/m.25147 type:complete len:211 (-) Transcript_7961:840-1472(-)